MKRLLRLVALILPLLLPVAAVAEVKIAASCRVKNRPPGRCGWCAVETLGRHHRIKQLHGLAQAHPTRTSLEDLEETLGEAGVGYRIQRPGWFGTGILNEAVSEGLGAAVGFRGVYPRAGGRNVPLGRLSPEGVPGVDAHDRDGPARTMGRG